jgi:hypothetical protein
MPCQCRDDPDRCWQWPGQGMLASYLYLHLHLHWGGLPGAAVRLTRTAVARRATP